MKFIGFGLVLLFVIMAAIAAALIVTLIVEVWR